MPGVAVKAKDFAGGAQLSGHATWFVVEDQPVVCLGDPVTPHPPDGKHKANPKMAECVDWFKIDGIGVCVEGQKADCGHATSGRSWFSITP